MADYKVTDTELTSIANAIRTKGGTSAQLEFPTGFVSAIGDISTGTEITSADNGKVVINATLAAQTARATNITENGTYDTTNNNSVTVAVQGGGSEINIYAVDYLGSILGNSVSSLSNTISGWNGFCGILCIMHRDTLTVSGWTLVDSRSVSGNGQYVSIYKKLIASDSENLTITQANSARMCATLWMADQTVDIEYKEYKSKTSNGSSSILTCDYLIKDTSLLVYDSYGQQTDSSYELLPYAKPNCIVNEPIKREYQVRHFSCVVFGNNNNSAETKVGEHKTKRNQYESNFNISSGECSISVLRYSIKKAS